MNIIFSHGKESGPWGSKIRRLAHIAQDMGWAVDSIDYTTSRAGVKADPDANFEADRRVEYLLAQKPVPCHSLVQPLPRHKLVLVGSSMGGYVSTVASKHLAVDGLFLLAPAFYLPGYADQDPTPHASHTTVVHGYGDGVVPVNNSVHFSSRHQCDLHLLKGDHRLNDALPKITRLFELFLEQVQCNHR